MKTLVKMAVDIQQIEQQLVLCPSVFPLLVPPDQTYLTQSLLSSLLNQPISNDHYSFLCCHFCC